MKRSNIALIFAVALLAGWSCKENAKQTPEKVNESTISMAEKIVDSLGLSEMISESRWALYCIHIDDTCAWKPTYRSLGKTYLSSLPLRLDFAFVRGDTVEVLYDFYYNDSLKCDYNSVSNFVEITDGVGINHKTKKQLYYLKGDGMFIQEGERSRYANPVQPEVKAFILANRDRLHPWLRDEAVRRGIIK